MPRWRSQPTVALGLPASALVLWLSLVVVVCYVSMFQGLESVGFIGPDEPRYAAVARDMSATGDWVTPRLNGEPWFEKPILYYWLAGLGYRVTGDGETAGRLPSAAAALATTLALGWIAWRLYGATSAGIVMLLFPTTVAAVGFARAATPDMLFTGAVASAMVIAASLLLPAPKKPSVVTQLAFGGAVGLAVLAKGPAGIVLVGGSLGLWAGVTGQSKRLFGLAGVPALAALSGVALPWYVLCTMRNPEFFGDFIVSHNLDRFFTPVFRHEQPFWFFVPVLLLGLVPWTPLVVVAAGRGVASFKAGRWASSPTLFFLCWTMFPLVFFSLSRSKLPGYVLPAVPALALVLAAALADSCADRRNGRGRQHPDFRANTRGTGKG